MIRKYFEMSRMTITSEIFWKKFLTSTKQSTPLHSICIIDIMTYKLSDAIFFVCVMHFCFVNVHKILILLHFLIFF